MSRGTERLGDPKPLTVLTGDGSTDSWANQYAQGDRLTFIATGGADFTAEVEVSHNNSDWCAFYVPLVFSGDDCVTLWINEPNSFIRVTMSGFVAGQLDTFIQEYK